MSERCLLVLSTFRYDEDAVRAALDVARGRLDVLYVRGHATVDDVDRNVAAEGHLGADPRAHVEDALEATHHDLMDERLAAIREAAERRGLELSVEEVEGPFYELVEQRASDYDAVVLVRPPGPIWQRIFGSGTGRLAERLRARGLEVTLVEA